MRLAFFIGGQAISAALMGPLDWHVLMGTAALVACWAGICSLSRRVGETAR